jgi:alanine dehydrogenase
MDMLIVDGATVVQIFTMTDAVALMRQAFTALTAGRVQQPLRQVLHAPGGEAFAVMPAWLSRDDGGTGALGVKTITVVPGNPARGLPAHNGLVLVFDPETGVPVAAVDAASVTAIRTAAASAVATDALALPDAGVVAVLGAGTQAHSHIEAMAAVRRVRQFRLWNRSPVRAHALAERVRARLDIPAVVCEEIPAATLTADIVCTTTASAQPLLSAADLAGGAHVNAVGASFPHTRELDGSVVRRARVFVDRRESALNEAGDLLVPMREGDFAAGDIRGEIGEVLLGRCPGRTGPDELTVFESLGLAVQDVLSARHIWERARELGVGVAVPLRAGHDTDHAGPPRSN